MSVPLYHTPYPSAVIANLRPDIVSVPFVDLPSDAVAVNLAVSDLAELIFSEVFESTSLAVVPAKAVQHNVKANVKNICLSDLVITL